MKFSTAASGLFLFISLLSSLAFGTEKVSLALNWKAEPQFGGFYSTSVNHFDTANGLTLDVQAGGAGTPVVQMVAAGKFDFGIASADEVIIARARGADVVALFAAYQTNPQAIMTHTERGYKSLADVYSSASPLAIQKGLPYAMFLEKKFSGHVTAQVVPYLGGIQNFLADKTYAQQCFATSEPLAAEKSGAQVKTFLIADEGYNPYTTVLIVRGEVLKKKEALVRAVVASVRSGWTDYLSNPAPVNARMRVLNPSMDEATFKAGAEAQKKLIESSDTKTKAVGTMTAERWTLLRSQLIEMKLVKADAAKADVNSYFRNF